MDDESVFRNFSRVSIKLQLTAITWIGIYSNRIKIKVLVVPDSGI